MFNNSRFAGVVCIKRGPIDDPAVRISSAASMTVFITVLAVTYLEHKACLSLSLDVPVNEEQFSLNGQYAWILY